MFQFIHLDLLGHTRTPSYNSFQYAMIVVDDFSKYTWIYFLQHKSEIFYSIYSFKTHVEQEFGCNIKCMRIDNGDEYMFEEFLIYCEKHGIGRQMTCPNTPRQNGIVERKLAHLTVVCLSWPHDKNLPKELWAEAFLCVCYAINRLPP